MTSLPLFLKQFLKDPFTTIDNLDLRFFGLQFNLIKDDAKLRAALFQIFFLIPLLAWLLLGSDSTADQVANLLLNTPNFLLGKINLNQLLNIYNHWYGLGTHWSASVIYSLLFIGLSKHLREKLDVKNSLNLAITTGFVGLTIATFEFYWQLSYAIFQGQWWVLWLQMPQARILLQNILFASVGLLVLLGFNWKEYKLNIDKSTVAAFTATICLILLWWFYPFPTQQLTVGIWTSSPLFPQTMWTIQPSPNVAYGELYHTENMGVHLTNNLAKIFMTLTFYSLFKIKEKKRHG